MRLDRLLDLDGDAGNDAATVQGLNRIHHPAIVARLMPITSRAQSKPLPGEAGSLKNNDYSNPHRR